MIQIAKKATLAIPIVLQDKGSEATTALITRYGNGEREFSSQDFDSTIYGHSEVKSALRDAQHNKCCFCESKISHISYGDVEHYRPKSGWIQDAEVLNKPGYYWLSYNWDNLLLACQICNQRHKKNHFPLRNNTNRAISHDQDIASEEPLFIHPTLDNPENFITFREEVPVAISGNDRGTITIDRLGLNRETLNDQRRSSLNLIICLYNLAKGIPDTNAALKQEAMEYIIGCYEESLRDETEYAAMKRAFFRQHPVSDL
jgi:uncharacterized protein (TIGR02646 family)